MQFGFRKSQVVFIISVLNSSLHVCMSLLTNMTNGALFKTCVLTERAIFLSNGKKNCTSISWELWSFVFLFFFLGTALTLVVPFVFCILERTVRCQVFFRQSI